MPGTLTLRVFDKGGVPLPGVRYEILECDGGACFGLIEREANDSSAVLLQIPDGEETITVRASKGRWQECRTFAKSKITYDFQSDLPAVTSNSQKLTIWSFVVGSVFMLLLLALSSFIPNPTLAQRQIWQGILSVALAAFANGILGLLEVNISMPKVGLTVRAIGAIAIAVIVYFFVPAFARDPAPLAPRGTAHTNAG